MGNREEYNTCMKPFISGHHEDRKRDFCVGAKICSGKASDEAEALKLCAEAALTPKIASTIKKVRKCKVDIAALATCIVRALDSTEITTANLTSHISKCMGQKSEQKVVPLDRKAFIKQCLKKTPVSGGMKEASKVLALCSAKWKEQEVA